MPNEERIGLPVLIGCRLLTSPVLLEVMCMLLVSCSRISERLIELTIDGSFYLLIELSSMAFVVETTLGFSGMLPMAFNSYGMDAPTLSCF